MNLIDLVSEILTPIGVPMKYELRPDSFPSISYHFFGEQGALFGDGELEQEVVSCQVDIWYKNKDDYIQIKKQVKSAMKKADFLFSNAMGTFEKDVRAYHEVLVFNFYYESEV